MNIILDSPLIYGFIENHFNLVDKFHIV